MTLEEAIKHAEEMAKIHCVLKNKYNQKCAEDHQQLAEWLKLLKRILDSGDCNNCGIFKVCQIKPNMGEQCRYNCPLFVEKGGEE